MIFWLFHLANCLNAQQMKTRLTGFHTFSSNLNVSEQKMESYPKWGNITLKNVSFITDCRVSSHEIGNLQPRKFKQFVWKLNSFRNAFRRKRMSTPRAVTDFKLLPNLISENRLFPSAFRIVQCSSRAGKLILMSSICRHNEYTTLRVYSIQLHDFSADLGARAPSPTDFGVILYHTNNYRLAICGEEHMRLGLINQRSISVRRLYSDRFNRTPWHPMQSTIMWNALICRVKDVWSLLRKWRTFDVLQWSKPCRLLFSLAYRRLITSFDWAKVFWKEPLIEVLNFAKSHMLNLLAEVFSMMHNSKLNWQKWTSILLNEIWAVKLRIL